MQEIEVVELLSVFLLRLLACPSPKAEAYQSVHSNTSSYDWMHGGHAL